MPVLQQRPAGDYKELAIIEGWSSPDRAAPLLQQVKSRACAAGADALVMIEDTSQVTKLHLYQPEPEESSGASPGFDASAQGAYLHSAEHIPKVGEPGHSGYYIDALAIVYQHRRDARH